jgi:alpha-L-rhamnosidase
MAFAAGVALAAPALHVTDLSVEYQSAPLAVETAQPRLSWKLTGEGRARRQTAYQLIVNQDAGAVVWNSGKVGSARNLHVVYAGAALERGRGYTWKVRVWDEAGSASAWSASSRWQMAPDARHWRAKWIGAGKDAVSPLLRTEFASHGKVRRATAYVVGLGWYELRLNGAKVGDLVLAPVNSNYQRVVYYDAYDVTSLVRAGVNGVGLWLANGYDAHYSQYGYRHGGPKRALLQLEVEYTDGRRESVVSDERWRAAEGPITANDIYNGESYDARRERSGWDRAGFREDASWRAVQAAPAPAGALHARQMPGIRAGAAIPPRSVHELKPGVWVYDLGQNIAGHVRIRVRGAAGTTLTIRHAEERHPDGTLDVTTNRSARATDRYTLKGAGEEVYEPRFTYHGFRYVEVHGARLESLEGVPVHAGVEDAGEFHCSNALVNRIHSNFRWAIVNNLMGIPTDTATRDERTPCQMDSVVVEDAAIHNFDMAAYYTKWLADIQGERSIPVWSSDQVLLPWRLYRYYGDERVLAAEYPNMKALVEHFAATAEKNGYWKGGYGDWCPPGPGGFRNSFSEGELVDTAVYYQSVRAVAESARVLGKAEDAVRFSALSEQIAAAFQARHYNAGAHRYGSGRQVTSVLPLAFGITPEADRAVVARALAAKIERDNTGHLDTGIFGTRYLFDVLLENGFEDLAYRVLTSTTAPGFGHQISLGATTTWEQWAYKVAMETHDHAMFAGPGSTFYTHLAGIEAAAPAYQRMVIRPRVPKQLKHVRAALETMLGRVESEWDTTRGYVHRVRIPVNATAEVYVPAADAKRVKAAGARFVRMEAGAAVFEVGSGSYTFAVI